jgi:hypothetical protein
MYSQESWDDRWSRQPMIGTLALDTHIVGQRRSVQSIRRCDQRPAARLASLGSRPLGHGQEVDGTSVEEHASVGGSSFSGGRASFGKRTPVGAGAPFSDMDFGHTRS